MRRALLAASGLAALVLASACSTPAPCTRALCPTRVEGSYRVEGWSGGVPAGGGSPLMPVVPDSRVTVASGEADFMVNGATVSAPAGSVFVFALSTASTPVPSISVSSGAVTVSVSSGAAATVSAGQTFALPAKK